MRQRTGGVDGGTPGSRRRSWRKVTFLALCAAVLGVASVSAAGAGALSLPSLPSSGTGGDTSSLLPTGGGSADSGTGPVDLGNSPTLPDLGGGSGGSTGSSGSSSDSSTNPLDPGDLPINPEWLANTLERASTTTSVKNNTLPEAIEPSRR